MQRAWKEYWAGRAFYFLHRVATLPKIKSAGTGITLMNQQELISLATPGFSPHPSGDESLWSCRPDFGKRVGRTSSATFKSAGHHNVRDEMVDAYRQAGWQIVADEELVSS